jgi:hypothetical protein
LNTSGHIPDVINRENPREKTDELLTKEQVMERLGISKTTLFVRIAGGVFHPVRDPKDRRKILIHPNEVEEEEKRCRDLYRSKRVIGRIPGPRTDIPMPPMLPIATVSQEGVGKILALKSNGTKKHDPRAEEAFIGEKSSQAFILFSEGKSIRDCVIALKMSFELAQKLYDQWKVSGTEWHLPFSQFGYLRKRFAWTEEPPTPVGFLAAVHKYIEKAVSDGIKEGLPQAAEQAPSVPGEEVPAQSSPAATEDRKTFYEKLAFPTDNISFD